MATNEDSNEDELEDRKEVEVPCEEVDDGIPYDGGWAWMIVLGSFLMHTILIGYLKTFGILFVEIQDLLQLSSSMTAWIVGIMQLVLNFFSPVANILSDHFSSRVVVMVGGLLQALALLLCGFAHNLGFLIATAGVLFGIGASLSYGPTIIMVGFYFKRRLALANSISLTGSSAGQFALPPLVTLLIHQYSVRGAFIFLAGIMLNITLAGMLLRPTSYYKRQKHLKDGEKSSDGTSECRTVSTCQPASTDNSKSYNAQSVSEPHKNGHATPLTLTSAPDIYKGYVLGEKGAFTSLSKLPADSPFCRKRNRNLLHLVPQHETFIYASNGDLFTSTQSVVIIDHEVALSDDSPQKSQSESRDSASRYCHLETWKKCLIGIIDFRLLKNPIFLLFALSCTCSNFGYIGQYRYIPARAKDLQITDQKRALLLSVTGITDLLARLLLGCVADTTLVRKHLGRYRLLAISMMLAGINSLLCPLTQNFSEFLVYSAFFGIFGGFYMTMVCVSLVDLLGRENLSRAWGIMLLLYGLMSLGEPLILGKLRDVTGSYDMSFRTCGCFFILASILIFCEQFAIKCRKKDVESKEGSTGEETTHLKDDSVP